MQKVWRKLFSWSGTTGKQFDANTDEFDTRAGFLPQCRVKRITQIARKRWASLRRREYLQPLSHVLWGRQRLSASATAYSPHYSRSQPNRPHPVTKHRTSQDPEYREKRIPGDERFYIPVRDMDGRVMTREERLLIKEFIDMDQQNQSKGR